MDVYEYCSVEVYISRAEYPPKLEYDPADPNKGFRAWDKWLKDSRVVVSIEKEKTEYFRIKDGLTRSGGESILNAKLYFNQSPITYMLPHFNSLGKDGWEVIEFKSSDVDNFGQALLKRKVQKE